MSNYEVTQISIIPSFVPSKIILLAKFKAFPILLIHGYVEALLDYVDFKFTTK